MMQPDGISRRAVLRGATATLASSFLDRRSWANNFNARAEVTIVVGNGNAGQIDPEFCGLSFEKSLLTAPFFSKQNQRLVGLCRRLGRGNLRIGGNSVDRTQWSEGGRGRAAGQVAPVDVDALGQFLEVTGWSTLYGVNLATSTPASAASEVAYVSKILGERLAGIEIGNEPDGYGGRYFGRLWTPAAATSRWSEFADAIVKQTPNVVLTGPGIGILNHVSDWTSSFAGALTPQIKQLRQLTQHYYRGDGHSPSSTMELLLTPDPSLEIALKRLQAISQQHGLSFRFTEANSFYNGGAIGVSNACGSALWALDFIFKLAEGGASGVNFQDGGNFTRGYTVISHQDSQVYGPQPEYYGLLFFKLAGSGILRPVSISADGAHATAHAIENRDGTLSIFIINKDATQNMMATVRTGRTFHKATARVLTMPSLTSTDGIMIQGSKVEKDGGFSPHPPADLRLTDGDLHISVSAASATLIQVV